MSSIAADNDVAVPTRLPARLLRLAGDERLVAHVRAGSAAAFEVLYDRHHRGVLAFCRHMLGSVEEAEDAVQHTFLAAYRELVGSQKAIRLRPWLYAIARNRCLSVLRRRREQPLSEHAEPATEHLAAEVQRREDLRHLLDDVARLPDDQRAALVLAELGDVSHEEIADVIGCGRDKVKALVFQARTSLNASRAARETSCHEIRQQLANLSGGALRRNTLRRHLRECAGCQEFHARVRDQRRALALVLPVAPSLGLKQAVLGSALGGGAAATGAGMAGGGLAAKALVAVAVAGGGTTAGVVTVNEIATPDRAARTAERTGSGALPAEQGGATTVAAPGAVGGGETNGGTGSAPAVGDALGRDAAPGHTDRGSSTPPGHTDRGRSSAPGQADRGGSSAPGHNGRGRSSAPGQADRGGSSAPGHNGRGRSSAPGQTDRGRSSAPGHTDRGRSTAPGQTDRGRSTAPSRTDRSRSTTRGRADRGRPPARGRTDGGRSTGSGRGHRGGSSAPGRTDRGRSTPPASSRGNGRAGSGEAKAQGGPEPKAADRTKESAPPPAATAPPTETAQPDPTEKQPKP